VPFPFAAALARMLGGGAARAAAGGAAEIGSVQGGLTRAAAMKAEQKEVTDAAGKTKSFTDRIREFRTAAFQASATTYFLKGVVEGAFGHMAGSATAAASVLHSMAEPFANLTRLANPAAVKLFEMAWEDALAVVGRAAVPLIDSFRRAMENVGDTYAKFEPFFTKFFERVGGAIEMVFSTMADMAERNAPLIDLMLTALGRAAQVFGYVASGAIYLVNTLNPVFNLFRALARALGFGDFAKGASSKGAAVRDVQITGSAEEFAREAQRKAFMQAVAGARGAPAKDPLQELFGISGTLTTIAGFVDGILGIARAWAAVKGVVAGGATGAGVGAGAAIGENPGAFAAGAAGAALGPVGEAIIDIAQSMRIFKLGG
jgi:hypothetical protein